MDNFFLRDETAFSSYAKQRNLFPSNIGVFHVSTVRTMKQEAKQEEKYDRGSCLKRKEETIAVCVWRATFRGSLHVVRVVENLDVNGSSVSRS